jgi:hypothetical protein
MARDANTLPEEGTMLCEACGYILTGLPDDSRCPECGQPISDSSPTLRHLPDWEIDNTAQTKTQRFWRTTAAVILHPTRFYRTLATRGHRNKSREFARMHWILVTLLFGWTGSLHLLWMFGITSWAGTPAWARRFYDLSNAGPVGSGLLLAIVGFLPCCALTYAVLIGATRLAARLTAWEARFRNLRLPHDVVLRGLDYHSPHYLPVAIVAFLTVAGYQLLLVTRILDDLSGPRYLYILCTEVVFAAAYLFKTYWTGMRNMMFANR